MVSNLFLSGCDSEAYVMSNPPLLIVSTDILDFGKLPVEYTATRKVQLLNAGNQTLTFDEMLIEGGESAFMLIPGHNEIAGGNPSIFCSLLRQERSKNMGQCSGLPATVKMKAPRR